MIWQNLVLSVGGGLFAIALLPVMACSEKPPLFTSVATASILFTFSIVYISLGLSSAAIITAANALIWAILALQRGVRRE